MATSTSSAPTVTSPTTWNSTTLNSATSRPTFSTRTSAAADVLDAKRRSALGRNVLEPAAADVLVEKVGLLVAELRVVEFHVVGDVTFGAENVEVAVVIVVEQFRAEGQRQKARLQSGLERHVLELQFAQVAVQRVVLSRKGREEDVREPVAVEVGDLGSHARHRLAVHVETGARGVRDVLERAVALVAVQEIAHAVIGDKDVRPAVQVDVAGHHTEPLPRPVGDARLDRDVGKGPIMVVVEQLGRHAVELLRVAVHAVAFLLVAAIG